MDPEYNILHPTVRETFRQTTDLVWPISEPANSKGDFFITFSPCSNDIILKILKIT